MHANEETLDTNLCYQALGVCISDSPQRITETYERLVRKCKAEFKSADPSVRETAREQLITIEEMYHTITNSVTYASQQRKVTSEQISNVAPKATVRHLTCHLTSCPACKAQLSKGMQSCPFCKTSLLTGWQEFQRKYLTGTKLLLFLLGLVSISLAVALARNHIMW